MEAAMAMDFHSLSRRELQALCKRNGVRANMTNAAMAEALQGLDSVDGIDEIGTSLCLPTPGRSAMKSAAKMVAVEVEEQQHGSPLPRGRRVSVKSPEAIRMEVEGGEDEMKEIVKTPGVALRSTRRGTRATPAPLPTPVPACSTRATRRTAARKTVEVAPTPATRRSQRTASSKAAGAVEADRPDEDVSEEKTSKMTMALDQEAAVAAAALKEKVQQNELKAAVSDEQCDDDDPKEEENVQQEEPKAVASDVKCDGPEEDVAKFLEGDNKEEELEEGEEATGSAAASVKSGTDPKVEELVVVLEEQPTKATEGVVKEQEPFSAEKSAPLTVVDDSPILGVIEKEHDASVEDCEDLAELSPAREMTDEIIPVTEDKEVAIDEEQDVSVERCEDLAELSPAREMTGEIIPVTEDKEVAINEEAVKEDGFVDAVEIDRTPKEILEEDEEDVTIDEDQVILAEGNGGAVGEMTRAGETIEEDEEDYPTELTEGAVDEVLKAELEDNETSEEDNDLIEVREGAAAKTLQGELTDNETSEEDDLDDNETSEEDGDDLIEVGEEGAVDEVLKAELEDNETSEEDNDLIEVREGAAAKTLQGELTDNETSEEDDLDDNETSEEDGDDLIEVGEEGAAAKMLKGELIDEENSEEDDLDEDEEWALDDDDNTEEMGSTDESDEDTDETNEEHHTAYAVQMLQRTVIAEEVNEDASTEDDDFSGDLPPEFDNLMIFSDAETDSDITPPVLEENQAAVASATKTVKSLDDSAMKGEPEDSPEEADATEKAKKEVDNIVKSLDDGESKEMQKQQPQDYDSMSLRKLRSTYKKCLIAAKEEVTEGKRLPLEELDENACIDH